MSIFNKRLRVRSWMMWAGHSCTFSRLPSAPDPQVDLLTCCLLQLFEISDVVLLDEQHEVGARNERRLVALHSNLTSGFEVSRIPARAARQHGASWERAP